MKRKPWPAIYAFLFVTLMLSAVPCRAQPTMVELQTPHASDGGGVPSQRLVQCHCHPSRCDTHGRARCRPALSLRHGAVRSGLVASSEPPRVKR